MEKVELKLREVWSYAFATRCPVLVYAVRPVLTYAVCMVLAYAMCAGLRCNRPVLREATCRYCQVRCVRAVSQTLTHARCPQARLQKEGSEQEALRRNAKELKELEKGLRAVLGSVQGGKLTEEGAKMMMTLRKEWGQSRGVRLLASLEEEVRCLLPATSLRDARH
eukprot:3824844-Rhodomonas_salina.2